jgi:hypothetical protein
VISGKYISSGSVSCSLRGWLVRGALVMVRVADTVKIALIVALKVYLPGKLNVDSLRGHIKDFG